MMTRTQQREQIEHRFKKDVATHQMKVLQDDGLHKHLEFTRPETYSHHFSITTWPGYLCISGDMGHYLFSRVEDMLGFFRSDRGDINPHYWAEKVKASSSPPSEFCPESFEEALKYRVENFDFNDLLIEEESEEDGILDEDGDLVYKYVWYWQEKETKDHKFEQDMYKLGAKLQPPDASKPQKHGPFDTEEQALAHVQSFVWNEIKAEVLPHSTSESDPAYAERAAYQAAMHFQSEKTGLDFEDFWDSDCREYRLNYLWCCWAIVWAIAQYDAHITQQTQEPALTA